METLFFLMLFFLFLSVPFIIVIIPIVFWIWMLVDVIQNEQNDELTMWILILILGNWVGAIIYYFVRKRKRSDVTMQGTQVNKKITN